MKIAKVAAIMLAVYIGIIAAAGAYVAYFQPNMPGVLVLTTVDTEGKVYDRLLGRFEVDGAYYLTANSWPRRWYNYAITEPNVEVTVDGKRIPFTAVRVEGAEHQRLVEEYPMPLWMRILAGFPPRRFLRLEPR